MAYVAFDLDNTLGFFEYTNPLSYLWSPDMLTNPEQARVNPAVSLPPILLRRLAAARKKFAQKLLRNHHLLFSILRPNLNTLIYPLLALKRNRRLKSVIIYSNSGVTASLELAKELIEKHYDCAGLFQVLADHWHPLRVQDRPPTYTPQPRTYVEPLKTPKVLKALFREATHERRVIPSKNILFVDDRRPKHAIQEEEPRGLTYIVPTPYYADLSKKDRLSLVAMAIESLDEAGIMDDSEYVDSAFCNRLIPYDFTKTYRISSFYELAEFVLAEVLSVRTPARAWEADTDVLRARISTFLEKI